MRIKVRDLDAGDIVMIEESDFDGDLYERVAAAPDDDVDDEDEDVSDDSDTREGDLELLLRETLEDRETALMKKLRKSIKDLRKPRRDLARRVVHAPTADETRTVVSRTQPTDPLYRRLYTRNDEMRYIRTPNLDHWNAQWIRALVGRDLRRMEMCADKLDALTGGQRATTLTGDVQANHGILDGTGGHLLPQPLANVVMIARDAAAVLPGLVQNFQMTSATLRIPTAASVAAAMADEGSAGSQVEPTFASEQLRASKGAAFMKASVEMVADSDFNLVGIYATRAGAGLGELEDVQICTTNGTFPNISEAIAGGNVDEATTTVLIYEDTVSLYFALGKTYRSNASWLGSAATLTLCSTLMDGNDRPIFQGVNERPTPVTDVPGAVGMMHNRPVYEVPLADGTLLFGDLAGYAFGRRSGIVAAVSEHADFASDLVQFKFTERFDGRIIDDVAMKQMSALATVA